jgi:hypothetical protein
MKRTVEKLVSFGTRHTLSSQTDPKRGIGAAVRWAEARMKGFGLRTLQTCDTVTGKRVPTPTKVCNAVAIQRGPQGAYVYVVGDDKTAQLKTIEVGTIVGDSATVTRGLAAGERVVVEGASQLRPGGKVAPIEPKRAGSNMPTSQKDAAKAGP